MKNIQKQKLKDSMFVLSVFLFFLFIIYKPNIVDGIKLTYTNLMYVFEPFKNWDVEIVGPWLSDPADNVLPIAFSSIHKGIFTFWLQNVGIGMPQSMSIYLFFMNYLYLLPFDDTQIVISVVKVSIAFLSMYLLMRRYKVSKHGAMISGITYSVCSTMVMWQGWPHSDVTMLAPFLFLFMDLLLEKFSIKYLLASAIVLFSMLVAGMPTYVAYFMYLLGCYVLYYGIKNFWHNKRRLVIYFCFFCGIVVLAALLSMPYTIDLLSTVGGNGYNASRKELSAATLDWNYLRTLYFPYIRNDLPIHINEATLYTGILSVITLPLSLLAVKKNPKQAFYLIALLVVGLTIFTDIFYPIYKFLPLVNTSIRFRLIVLVNFCLSINLGMTIDYLLSSSNLSNKLKTAQFILLSTGVAVFIGVYMGISKLDLTEIYLTQVHNALFIVMIFYSLSIVYIIFPFKFSKKMLVVGVLLLSISDSAMFAQNYIPGVNAEASVIPEATDTIKYLQENTENQEKLAPIGQWTFFASSNVYYDLRDVRGHNFVYTNEDMQNYYTSIDEYAYTTPTRVAFQTIQNENLLKYMGVKYTIDALTNFTDRKASEEGVTPFEGMTDGDSITQTFTATLEGLSAIQLFVGTYGQKDFTEQDTVSLTLTDLESGSIVSKSTQSLMGQKDNDYFLFKFDRLKSSADLQYQLNIEVNLSDGKQITFYQSNQPTYAGLFNNDKENKNLVLLPLYVSEKSRIGRDGLVATQLDDYSEQVQLTDDLEILSSDKDVLEAMKKEYKKTTAFFITKMYPKIVNATKLSSDERVFDVQNQSDGTLSFNVHLNEERIVLVNEYNDGNWSAYVDGKKTKVYKGNYLYRAMKVDAGDHQVILKYENNSVKKYLLIMFISALGMLLLFIFRRKLESIVKNFGSMKKKYH